MDSFTNENIRITIDKTLDDFTKQHVLDSYTFQLNLDKSSRQYVHKRCLKLGLKSKSSGSGANRFVTVTRIQKDGLQESFMVPVSDTTQNILRHFKVVPKRHKNNSLNIRAHSAADISGKLSRYPPVEVPRSVPNPLQDFRKTLSIAEMKTDILNAITKYRTVIISAETGSGKTTQIPQFILEDACDNGKRVRVICTQPRRLSTIAVANRVADERGEFLGQTVGYQIKLENRMGPKTSLLYCTNGVLLRTLMAGSSCFQHITHVIVDEIHERDKYADFLMICLRRSMMQYPALRVVLMSATMDIDILQNYFDKPHVINVSGRSFEISTWFLDDILTKTGYENEHMKRLRKLRECDPTSSKKQKVLPSRPASVKADPEVLAEASETVAQCFLLGSEQDFTHLSQLILTEGVPPNHQDQNSGVTPLMAASKHGNLEFVEQLLNMGADPFMTCANGITAAGYAQQFEQETAVDLLALYQPLQMPTDDAAPQVLHDYDQSLKEQHIDFNLIVSLINYIQNSMDPSGAILVFLPGYDEIMQCNEKIKEGNLKQNRIFILHGSMHTASQNEVFCKMNPGTQKIILSTNLAETSITIDDVMYVIDTGKVKEKSYDAFNSISSLQTTWISMASARQRAGRAGRTRNGYCFHLYSYSRYESFCVNTTPEILRVPLHELCLNTKLLAPELMKIESFLNESISPPSSIAVNNSIKLLKNLGALDEDENLTPLGYHLVQLSIEPQLGKMLIYASIFKCLNPVLTIVAALAHKDPFRLPAHAHQKNQVSERRKQLASGTLSDHMILLRAYQMYQEAKGGKGLHRFYNDYFISPATMELIQQTRDQLMNQLRSIGFVQNDNATDTHSNNWALIKACLSVGFYPNVAFYNNGKLHTRTEKSVVINSGSCVRRSAYENDSSTVRHCWLVFEELMKQQTKCFIRMATVITPLSVALMCGLKHSSSECGIIIDDWFDLNYQEEQVTNLRDCIANIVQKKIHSAAYRLTPEDDHVIDTLQAILEGEDSSLGLDNPENVGWHDNANHNRYRNQNSNKYNSNRYGGNKNDGRNGGAKWGKYDNWRDNQNQQNRPGPSREVNFEGSRYQRQQQNRGDFERFPINYKLFPKESKYFVFETDDNYFPTATHYQWKGNVPDHIGRNICVLFSEGYDIILIFTWCRDTSVFKVAHMNGIDQNETIALGWICQVNVRTPEIENLLRSLDQRGQLASEDGQRLCSHLYKLDMDQNSWRKR